MAVGFLQDSIGNNIVVLYLLVVLLFYITEAPEITSFCIEGKKNCSTEMEAEEFSTLLLTCKASASPQPVFNWTYLGTNESNPEGLLNRTENRIIDFRNGTLKIKDLNRGDTGFYECHADNNVGQPDSAVMYLRVKGETKTLILYQKDKSSYSTNFFHFERTTAITKSTL